MVAGRISESGNCRPLLLTSIEHSALRYVLLGQVIEFVILLLLGTAESGPWGSDALDRFTSKYF